MIFFISDKDTDKPDISDSFFKQYLEAFSPDYFKPWLQFQ